jgi:hypothetical protein
MGQTQYSGKEFEQGKDTSLALNGNGPSFVDQALLNEVIGESKGFDEENAEIDFSELAEKCLVSAKGEEYPPQNILFIGDAPVMSIGDFSLFIGKAKSRKTFAITLIMAVMLCKVIEQMRAQNFKGKARLVWFDTEQSRYYVQRALRTALRLAGIEDAIEIEVYSTRPFSPEERRGIINQVLYENNQECNISFAIIDGIRDLVTDINDQKQSTDIATWLLKITDEKQIHISTVLHTNKNDNNARGHLGAELTNKAQTVLMIEKSTENKDVSIVKPEYCRDKDFEPFAFMIDEDGLPVLLDDFNEPTSKKEAPKNNPFDFELAVHHRLACEIFERTKEIRPGDLKLEIKRVFAKHYIRFGDHKSREFLKHWEAEGIITGNGQNGRNALYTCNTTLSVDN